MTTITSPQQLTQIFSSIPPSDHPRQWDTCYRDSFHPWDRAGPSLALADLLLQRRDLVPPLTTSVHGNSRRTALVPGCGLGHDVRLLASFGYDVVGLDVSEAALQGARKQQAEVDEDRQYPTQGSVERGSITWLAADFFSQDWAEGLGTDGGGKFDLIFDYTFLCALPLELRPQWARRMSDLLHSKGRLVCLEFPSGKALREGGPPWGLSPEVYEALLDAPGEPVAYDKDGDGIVVSKPSSKPRHNALQRLCLVKPPRTHEAGLAEDGSVKDFISVWKF